MTLRSKLSWKITNNASLSIVEGRTLLKPKQRPLDLREAGAVACGELPIKAKSPASLPGFSVSGLERDRKA
ncbi:hypothetical protein [Labrenzia sp. THAF82]|uniref:hypothetical protein n=1 Tax=Labrenzia sp. THAF82 TaxID=2587861 RepID=UPI0012697EE7|nr:hypothetical protein [Labrenzia sp. THAF82]